MDSELTSAQRRPDEQRQYNLSNIVRKSSRRQTLFPDDIHEGWEMLHEITIDGFCSFMQLPHVRLFMLGVFICIGITGGVLIVYFTAPKPSKSCQLVFRRTMTSSIVPNPQSKSTATADLNNDHQMDIVVANAGTDTIGIFLSQGNGIFTNQQTYATGFGSHPYSLVISDFNNDTYLDIAVANYGTNNIGIFLGNGNGTFIDQKLFSLGSSRPLFINIGDFNNDRRMDIATANNGTNTIGILLGYGNGSFQDQITYSTGYDSMPYALVIGDFNKDNQLDIAVANYGTSNVGIFLGHNNGTFGNQTIYTTTHNSNPTSIALGDFNNDNHLDLVVANYRIGTVGIFLGHSNGSFLPQITYTINSNAYPQYVTVGDLNKDNELDIVILDSANDQVHIIPGYGNGRFGSITTYDGVFGSTPFSAALADFNSNNQSDIVVVDYGTSNILVLIDYFIKPSARQINYDVGIPGVTGGVVTGDFNNDHILDIVSYTDKDLIILNGLGNGLFGNAAKFPIGITPNIEYFGVGDLNNDNQMDVIITDVTSNIVGIFFGHGNGTFTTMTTYSTGIGSNPYWIGVGDVNNDNRTDMISANKDTNNIGIFFGNSDGTFNTMMTYSTGIDPGPTSLALGDINNDNQLDIVVTTWDDDVIIFIGYGNGSFIIQETYPTIPYAGTFSVALADFNGDNYLDIVIATYVANCIIVYLGHGDGTFTAQKPYATGSATQSSYVIVADFNNDNISDIAVTNFGSDDVVMFQGYGNGSFSEPPISYPTGSGSKPLGIIAADFDNNKQLEFVVALWGTGAIAILTKYDAAEFNTQIKYSTGSPLHPYSVVAGDFNNDNRSDIVVANSGNGSLGILFGSNNGTFGMEMIYPIGTDSYPQYVMSCDINKDNHLDIVSVNSKINSVSVIMGYGNGSFAEQLIYSTGDGSQPSAVVSGDVNNDTRLDLIVANEGTDSIGILFGFNYTSFQTQVTYSNTYVIGPAGIVISDFNNDNYLDIAATYNLNDLFGIFLGYGNGSFDDIGSYYTGSGSQPWGIAVGDFDNDNQSDIVATNTGTSTIAVRLGYGDGSFNVRMTYSTGDNAYPIAVAVGHFNNDSRLDIVVANIDADNVGVLLGYGNGSFSIVQTYFTGQGSAPRSVIVGDFNNDGQLDIAVANSGTNNVGVLLGYGDGTFKDHITFSTGDNSHPSWVVVGNFNSDHQMDIASANWNTNNVGILLGYGNGTFSEIITYSTGSGSIPSCISVGDFNNDNISDVAVTNFGTSNVVVLFGIGDGSFLLGTAYSTHLGSQPFALAVADFNNDSRLDVAVVNNHWDNIGVFLGSHNQPFAGITSYTTGDGSKPHSITLGDLNNDGWSDVVVANYGTDNVGVLLGRSSRAFQPMIKYQTGIDSAPYSVGLADFNNDDYLDIVVSNSGTDNIAILLGYGNGTFAFEMMYSTGARSRPYIVTISDFNNDNISDIAVANSGTSNIFVSYGYGDGTFGNETSYSFGYGYQPYSVAVSDLNRDGWIDMIIACYGTDHIETQIKMC